MSFLTQLIGGGDVVKSVGETLDNLFTSDEERLEAKHEMTKAQRHFDYLDHQLVAQQNVAQMEVNKVDAASSNFFQSGWRPAVGWIGVLALAYQFVLYPLLLWAKTFVPELQPPTPLNSDMMFSIITGMLGIAGLRSFDKIKGTDTRAAAASSTS
jgi:hypothetical protein